MIKAMLQFKLHTTLIGVVPFKKVFQQCLQNQMSKVSTSSHFYLIFKKHILLLIAKAAVENVFFSFK